MELLGINDGSLVEVDIIEVDGVFDLTQNADDNKFGAKNGESFADDISAIKQLQRERTADDSSVGRDGGIEEGASLERKWLNFGEI